MHMGRWFGYRGGYAKLCRIWMSRESIEWYRHISQSTDELRDEIERYQNTGLTPKDFGLRVRSDITSLLVTARNKMRSAESRECVISLSGEYIETPEIYSSDAINEKHIRVINEYIETLIEDGVSLDKTIMRNGGLHYGFKNINKSQILSFLEQLDVSPKNVSFNVSAILKFIKDYQGDELNRWDISFATGSTTNDFSLAGNVQFKNPSRKYSLINDGKILKMLGSSRKLGTPNDAAYGMLDSDLRKVRSRKKNPSQKDYFIDVSRNPLLIIYIVTLTDLVDTESEYIDLGETYKGKNVVGFGLGIPTLSNQKTKYATYVLNRIAIENMFAGETDDWDEENDD